MVVSGTVVACANVARSFFSRLHAVRQRQRDRDPQTALGRVVEDDGAAVGVHELTDDREPEPESPAVSTGGAGAPEAVERASALLGRHPWTRVAHLEPRLFSIASRVDVQR